MTEIEYNRSKAVDYAHFWAFKRNPQYYDFTGIGGDCTNFCSQCLYSAARIFNYNSNLGWYYHNAGSRSPSWTDVEYLYKFLVSNKGAGPYGQECDIGNIAEGDLIQLSFDGLRFSHSLIVVGIDGASPEKIYIATHSYDSDNRPLYTYAYKHIRFIHIKGVRK